MDAGRSTRRPVEAAALALAALALALLGAQAIADRGVGVVDHGSVTPVLDHDRHYDATLITTRSAFRALEVGLVDGDRLPAAGPPLLVARVVQQGAGSWCTSASAEVTTAADGTIRVEVSRPWWRRFPPLHCMQDVPAHSGLIVALDEHELAAAPAVELTGGIVALEVIRCTPEERPGGRDWVCKETLGLSAGEAGYPASSSASGTALPRYSSSALAAAVGAWARRA